jgi:phospholipase C
MARNTLQRREFLRKTAGLFGAAAGFGALPPVIRRALAVEPSQPTGTINDVEHVVILMQENRSFDHYFGTLRGVRGFGDRFPIPLANGKPVWFQSNGTTDIPPFRLDSQISSALLVGDTPHQFSDAQAAWGQGKFGEWPRYKTDNSMGHYTREDIPFQFALAEAFTICDAYHCSLTSCTDPNRIVAFSGSNSDPTLRQQGINCTDSNAEVANVRCVVSGAMPSPGYGFNGSAFAWPTIPELLEGAGVSWRIYQDPNDNWSGLMHGGLAFASFRAATAAANSSLYQNGMQHWSLTDLRNDVIAGTLPAVSWILPSRLQSEHPAAGSSPLRAGDFISQVLDALTASNASWSKTVLFVTFDENDGFFDHVPAPAVPSYNADGTLAGGSTLPLAGEYFADPAGAYRLADDTISGALRPWGLGARVPMYVVSPWSRGGWVNSQVYDHTSIGRFLEQRFGITVASISPWRRAVCGDLTSALDFSRTDTTALAALPDTSDYLAVEQQQRALPPPGPPASPVAFLQEPGTRPSRALPYELHTSARVANGGLVTLIFSNTGSQGAVFHVYDLLHLDRIPRRYTVEAGTSLRDTWDTLATDQGNYQLNVYGPNGFVRGFQGNGQEQAKSGFAPEAQICYAPSVGKIYLKVHNTDAAAGRVTVRAEAYRSDGPWTLEVAGQASTEQAWQLSPSGGWYDFTVTANFAIRRFAGRMETGEDSTSDPAILQAVD